MRVFEYGAGMSSLWYAARVAEVVSVEHDPEWAAEVRRDLPSNCTLLLEPDVDAYVAAITGHVPFDIVVIDGLARTDAAAAAVDGLKDDGVIIWDNSDWPEFGEAYPALHGQGFRRLDFAGLGPISRAGWQTSVLYRDHNCLGI
jgi:predicted O-methyltransferase YrrM